MGGVRAFRESFWIKVSIKKKTRFWDLESFRVWWGNSYEGNFEAKFGWSNGDGNEQTWCQIKDESKDFPLVSYTPLAT